MKSTLIRMTIAGLVITFLFLDFSGLVFRPNHDPLPQAIPPTQAAPTSDQPPPSPPVAAPMPPQPTTVSWDIFVK